MDLFSFVKSRISIVDVVKEYTTLKPAGSYWKGVCPFHHEKTPSFTVSPHRDIYYCFGCHRGGDVISFIAQAESCGQKQAALLLAERFGIDLPEEFQVQQSDRDAKKIYVACYTLVSTWAHTHALNSKTVMAYLVQRGIDLQATKTFCLGFFPRGQAALREILALAKTQGILEQDFIDAHIFSRSQNDVLFSHFEDRILFPIYSYIGDCVAFGGRIWRADDTRAKYINSQEHEFFAKGSTLYGFSLAKKQIQKEQCAILVEGYTDAIALSTHGYSHVVASLGTACNEGQLKLLARYAPRVMVMYDGDSAGQKAMLRLASFAWESSVDLFIARLPGNDDPASFVEHGGDVSEILMQASDVFTFFIAQQSGNKGSLSEKLEALKEIIDVVLSVGDPLKQDLLLQQAAEACGVSLEALKKSFGRKKTLQPIVREIAGEKDTTSSTEREFFTFLLTYSECVNLLDEQDRNLIVAFMPERLSNIIRIYFDLCVYVDSQGLLHGLLERVSEDDRALISKMLMQIDRKPLPQDFFEEFLRAFYKRQWKSCVTNVKIKLENCSDEKNKETVLKEIQALRRTMVAKGIL
ncbi:MAG: primase protein [candidate division TM6 bacterium GW2011_GWE2_41_16]|nr:MAG: primase protein [candidate division TM6 bacterium GW2011_GWE2_41_16]